MESLGIIEVVGVVAAIESLDAMTKTSNVRFVTTEKKLGGRLVTVIVEGKVDEVMAAVEAGVITANRITSCAASAVIPRPHEEIVSLLERSSKKFK